MKLNKKILLFITALLCMITIWQTFLSLYFTPENYSTYNCDQQCPFYTQCQQTTLLFKADNGGGIPLIVNPSYYNCVGYLYKPLSNLNLIHSKYLEY